MGQFGIGQPVRRFEDKRLLCGNGRFQNDVTLPGQAYGFVLRSPHAHAVMRRVDLSAAQAAPGVLAIYTGEDLRPVSQKAARRESCRWATIA
jgi:carbon-monoxide dehydrogenase large subunit